MTAQTLPNPELDQQGEWRFWRRLNVLWSSFGYLFIALGVYDLWTERPELLRGWAGIGLGLIVVAFLSLFHFVFLRFEGTMSSRRALLYGAAQSLLIALLVRYNPTFGSLGYWLLAYLIGVLPPRLWFAPIVVILSVIAPAWGVLENVRRSNWDDVGLQLLQIILWFAVVISMRLLGEKSTQLYALVDQLRKAKQELERSAAQAEELAALRERTRLAREMHDSLGHALVVVNVKLEAAERLYAVDARRGAAELEATRALVRETMAELRRSLANLRAPMPDYTNLPQALQRMAADASAHGNLAVTCDTSPELPALTQDTAEALWRVARESLANVERHAGAASASITLERCDGSVVLRIVDDGSGIRPSDLQRPSHYGIIGMRERVEALGGTLCVVASPHGGTVVEASAPV